MSDYTIPGVHHMSAQTYHADPMPRPSLSSGLGRIIIKRSPRHAWTASARLNPDFVQTESKVFDEGRAAHREFLGAGDPYVVIPSGLLSSSGGVQTKEAKAFVADCRSRGITPLKQEQADRLIAMRDVCREVLPQIKVQVGSGIVEPIRLDPADSEQAALAEIDGCPCRALFDGLPVDRPYFVDFKTTQDASVEACIRAIDSYDYAFQLAFYRDTLHAVTGEWRRPLIVFQEKEPPFEISVVGPYRGEDDASWFHTADDKVRTARYLWARCLAGGVERERWPGYPRQVATVGAPSWYVSKWENRAKPSLEALERAAEWQEPEGN